MAVNDITVVTGVNNSVALAAAALDTALSAIETDRTVFLCEMYKEGLNWHHVLVHQTAA
jgi:hypothetical protein